MRSGSSSIFGGEGPLHISSFRQGEARHHADGEQEGRNTFHFYFLFEAIHGQPPSGVFCLNSACRLSRELNSGAAAALRPKTKPE